MRPVRDLLAVGAASGGAGGSCGWSLHIYAEAESERNAVRQPAIRSRRRPTRSCHSRARAISCSCCRRCRPLTAPAGQGGRTGWGWLAEPLGRHRQSRATGFSCACG